MDHLELWVEVLDEPVDANVVAVVLLPNYCPHCLDDWLFCVVKVHEVPTHEGKPHQTKRKHIAFFDFSVLEAFLLRVLEETDCVGDYRRDVANCVLLPFLEATLELGAINIDIIVYNEEHLCLALSWDLVSPVH